MIRLLALATCCVTCLLACGAAFDSVEGTSGAGGDPSTSAATGGGATGGGSDGGGAASGAGGSGDAGNGGVGGFACLSCLEAITSAGAVEVGQVCDGVERQNFVELEKCICDVVGVATCQDCSNFCSSLSGPSMSCLSCVDDADTCDDLGVACGVGRF